MDWVFSFPLKQVFFMLMWWVRRREGAWRGLSRVPGKVQRSPGHVLAALGYSKGEYDSHT